MKIMTIQNTCTNSMSFVIGQQLVAHLLPAELNGDTWSNGGKK